MDDGVLLESYNTTSPRSQLKIYIYLFFHYSVLINIVLLQIEKGSQANL